MPAFVCIRERLVMLRRSAERSVRTMEFNMSNSCYNRCEKPVIIGHNRSSNPAGASKTRVGGTKRSGSAVGFRSFAEPRP